MKRLVLGAAMLVALAAPASAQIYYPQQGGGYGGGGYGGGYGGYGGGYEQEYESPRRRSPYQYGPPRSYERRVQLGSMCVTSRGSCYVGRAALNSGCACNIPGFGRKRGAVLQ
jgi:opacity protein-like surface antigen